MKTRLLYFMLIILLTGAVKAALYGQEAENNTTAEASGETEEEITNGDIIEILEEINEKLDKLLPRQTLQKKLSWTAGITPGKFLYLFDMGSINSYIGGLGIYGELSGFFYPLANGFSFYLEMELYNTIKLGLDFDNYNTDTYGTALFAMNDLAYVNEPGVGETTDANSDGISDYYSDINYVMTLMELYAQGDLYRRDEAFRFYVGGKLGFGRDKIQFLASENSLLENLTGKLLNEDERSWSRGFFSAGLYGGMDVFIGTVLFTVKSGYTYHLPTERWQPSAGLTALGNPPPENFNSMQWWFVIGPVFKL